MIKRISIVVSVVLALVVFAASADQPKYGFPPSAVNAAGMSKKAISVCTSAGCASNTTIYPADVEITSGSDVGIFEAITNGARISGQTAIDANSVLELRAGGSSPTTGQLTLNGSGVIAGDPAGNSVGLSIDTGIKSVSVGLNAVDGAKNPYTTILSDGANNLSFIQLGSTTYAVGLYVKEATGANVLQVQGGVFRPEEGLTIGATGTKIAASYRVTSTIDIASIAANVCATDSTITVTGAVTGAECIVGSPAALNAGLQQSCYVSAADTVKLRTCNNTAGAIDPASATYSVRVFNP